MLVFYIVAAAPLGFIPTATICLVALFLKLRVRSPAIVVAIVATLVIHTLFYKLLRVPCRGAYSSRSSGEMTAILTAFRLVFEPYTIAVILASAAFGLFGSAGPRAHRDDGHGAWCRSPSSCRRCRRSPPS